MTSAAHLTAQLKALAEETARTYAIDPGRAASGGLTRVRRKAGLACEIEDGSWRLVADLPESAGGASEGPDPGTLLRGALGACLAMDIVTWAARLDVAVGEVAVEVESAIDARGNLGVAAGVPPGYRAVACRIAVESPESDAAVGRAVDMAAAHNPRLYDLTHAIPVRRELTVIRPAPTQALVPPVPPHAVDGAVADGVEPTIVRPARREDCGDIARLFLIASDGLAGYIWSRVGPAGAAPLEVGRQRYAREGVAFSYQNCLVAERDGEVVAMLHSFPMPPREEGGDGAKETAETGETAETEDPVLAPYAALEDPGSLYVAGLAVDPEHRGLGLGRRLMAEARARAETLGLPRLSLICFERNERALTLYRRLGFVEVDRRPIVPHPSLEVRDGDALLLVRGLD